MADLNDPNKPVITDLYADVIDTLRENTKRVSTNSMPVSGGGFTGGISAPGFYHMPGGYPVWHAGNLDPNTYMPKTGGQFTGAILLVNNASAPMHPVPLGHLQSFQYLQDAPFNNVYYGRRNGAWEPVAPRTVDDALIGSIMARPVWVGTTEAAWVECAGSVLNKATYARLWAWVVNVSGLFAVNDTDWNNWNWGKFVDLDANNFRIPYLVGQFVRVSNTTGTGLDIGRPPGSAQSHAYEFHGHAVNDPGHAHTMDDIYHDGAPSAPSIATQSGAGYGIGELSHPSNTYASGTGLSVVPQGATETRPANVAYRHFLYAGNPLA